MTDKRWLLAGIAGFVGALLTGIGEGLLQLSPGADYTDPSYGYFALIDTPRQSLGHFLSVLSAPLYLAGYWHLTRNLAATRTQLANILFVLTSYAFILATVWIGQRFFLAQTVKAIETGLATPELLNIFAAHNEPFVNALRVAIAVFSVIWIWLVATGQSRYPRWMAIFSPAALLAAIFGFYFIAPDLGSLLLPTAMNTAHFVVFGLSLLTLMWRKNKTEVL